MSEEAAYRLFFKAVSNKSRLRIIRLLQRGPLSVGDICISLGLEQSYVSHALRCLTDCGFVEIRKKGKQRIYSINQGTIAPILRLIDVHSRKYYRHLEKCGVLG